MSKNEILNKCYIVFEKCCPDIPMRHSMVDNLLIQIGSNTSDRHISECSIQMAWLYAGKPDRVKWRYGERIEYADRVLSFWDTLTTPEARELALDWTDDETPPSTPGGSA